VNALNSILQDEAPLVSIETLSGSLEFLVTLIAPSPRMVRESGSTFLKYTNEVSKHV
jgi:hypothetical protein